MRRLYLLGMLVILSFAVSLGCTTAVISGKFTKSGRPMIWKVRDTEEYDNYVRRYSGPNGAYVGLVNSSDSEGGQIWGGHNSRGFAIMNSASFNVNLNDDAKIHDQEGYVMRRALEECETLADFEKMLEGMPKPMGLAAHFGVIDAQGGAAFYEVNNYTWKKYDANDPGETQRGYVLRTNFSETGKENVGYGYIRYGAACGLFNGINNHELTVSDLVCSFSRSMFHGLIGVDYRRYAEEGKGTKFVCSDDLICRFGTSSMILIEGVEKGEDPQLTTSWIQIGLPYTSAVVPVWTWSEIPEELAAKGPDCLSPLSVAATKLKNDIYPLKTSERERYIRLDLLFNKEGTGICQRLEEIEKPMIRKVQKIVADKKMKLAEKMTALKTLNNHYCAECIRPLYQELCAPIK